MPPATTFTMRGQYKRICVTVNLPDDKDWEMYDLRALRVELNPTFMIMGRETGEQGRKHFQGFFELEKKKTGSVIDKIFRNRFPLPISVHFEVALGTAQQNIEYCSKEDQEPYIFGEPKSGQGSRTDLQQVFKDIREGMSERDIAERDPHLFLQHHRGLSKYRGMVEPKRDKPTQLIFLWGPTGTGKTMHAQELRPVTVNWVSNTFLNGFHPGDKTLLFDDFDYKKMDWQTFLTMTDRYAMEINIKGGSCNFAPDTIIFTSNSDPKGWWPEAPEETRKAIHRRMDEYGDIRYLGTLVPKEQTLLQKYFARPASAPAAAAASALSDDTPTGRPLLRRPAAAGATRPPPVVLGGNEDSDSDHSTLSVNRRIKLRTERNISQDVEDIVIIESDTEEDEESLL